MKRLATIVLPWLLAAVACSAVPELLTDCDYEAVSGGQEFLFVLPSFEEFVATGGAPTFYTAPDRSSPLWLTSWRYKRDYAGRRYRLLETVEGEDGRYRQWLMEDCRLLYSPVEEGQ